MHLGSMKCCSADYNSFNDCFLVLVRHELHGFLVHLRSASQELRLSTRHMASNRWVCLLVTHRSDYEIHETGEQITCALISRLTSLVNSLSFLKIVITCFLFSIAIFKSSWSQKTHLKVFFDAFPLSLPIPKQHGWSGLRPLHNLKWLAVLQNNKRDSSYANANGTSNDYWSGYIVLVARLTILLSVNRAKVSSPSETNRTLRTPSLMAWPPEVLDRRFYWTSLQD